MAITLDSFRQFTGNNVVMGGQQGGETLQKAGIFHGLKSKHDMGTARAQNQQVVDTLRQLINNDSRYMGIRNQANAMLDAMRTDRPISANTVKTLVSYLDAATTPEQRQNLGMSRAIARAAQQNQQDGYLFGMPDAQDQTPEARAAYSDKLKTFYETAVATSVRNNAPLTDAALDLICTGFAKAQQAGLPDADAQIMVQGMVRKNIDAGELDQAITYMMQINDNDNINDSEKDSFKKGLFNTGAMLTQEQFEQYQSVREALTLITLVKNAPETSARIEDSLRGLGLQNTDTAVANILKRFEGSMQGRLAGWTEPGHHLTRADCDAKLAQQLTQVTEAANAMGIQNVDAPDHAAVVRCMENITNGLPHATYTTALKDLARQAVAQGLGAFSQANTVMDMFHAVRQLSGSVSGNIFPMDEKPEMGSSLVPAYRAVMDLAVSVMPQEQRESLLESLHSNTSTALYSLMASSGFSAEAMHAAVCMDALNEALLQSLGRLAEGELPELPAAAEDGPAIPASLAARYSDSVRDAFNVGQDVRVGSDDMTGRDLAKKAGLNFNQMMQATLQSEMRKIANGELFTFQKDITRNLEIHLPGENNVIAYDLNEALDTYAVATSGGAVLSYDALSEDEQQVAVATVKAQILTDAKNQIAAFIAGAPVGNYEALGAAQKTQVDLLLALTSQEFSKGGEAAFSVALGGGQPAFMSVDSNPFGQAEQARPFYTFSKTADGGLTVEFQRERQHNMFTTQNGVVMLPEGQPAQEQTLYRLNIAGEEVTRLSQLDWAGFAQRPLAENLRQLSMEELTQYTEQPGVEREFLLRGDFLVASSYLVQE